MTNWQRADWEQLVTASQRPGVVATALALASAADADGVAVPGLAQLAGESSCSVSTAYTRLVALLAAGLLERDGKAHIKPGGPMCRYRLVTPAAVDA